MKTCTSCGARKADTEFAAADDPALCASCERDFAENVTDDPWDGSPARFSDEQYVRSCLIDRGAGAKERRYALAVREPDGKLNKNAVRAAASKLYSLSDVSEQGKASAAMRLRSIMRATGMAEKDKLDTVDLDGIELMSTGGPYHGSGSEDEGDFFTVADLAQIAEANNALSEEIHPPLKLGHGRGQKLLSNSGVFTDELPAAGWLTNFRVDGTKLVGDLKAVPKKLAQLLPHGYRKRSVELSRVTTQDGSGKVYENVITGLALLGARNPAIRKLTDVQNIDDVLAWYALEDDGKREIVSDIEVTPTLVTLAATGALPDTESIAEAIRTELLRTGHLSAKAHDTKAVDGNDKKPVALTDEQVTALAETFGIEESDAARRREAVLAKFAEHVTKPEADAEAEAKAKADADAKAKADADEKARAEKEKEATALSEKTFEDMLDARDKARAADGNIHVALLAGAIEPAEADSWKKMFAEDYDSALAILKPLVKRAAEHPQTRAFGSDTSGSKDRLDQARKQFDDLYGRYAQATGVPRIERGETK